MRALTIAAMLIICCSPAMRLDASAQQYSAQVFGQPVTIGSNTWEYSLTNTSPITDYTVWLLAIELDEATDVISTPSPTGWACDTSVPHFISWMYIASELPAGQSQAGFTADLSKTPEYQLWTVMFNNIRNPGESPSDCGKLGAVPEPASLVGLLAGISSIIGLKLRRRV
jgi:hypothetical protein